MAKITMKSWEGSKKDNAIDKKMAKKKGISRKAWEGSKADEKVDAAAVKRANQRSAPPRKKAK